MNAAHQPAPAPVKRFVLFASEDYYPAGGWGDFVGSFDTYAEARAAGEPHDKAGRLCQVIDLTTGLDVWQ